MDLNNVYFVASRTGIRMSLQAWLELIADKYFGTLYAFEPSKCQAKFTELKDEGFFIDG